MTTIGILASRYAKAFYEYAHDNGEDVKVYGEMKYLSYQLLNVSELRRYLNNPILGAERKIEMLILASGENVSASTKRFFEFIFEKEKAEYLLYIAMSYQTVYRKRNKIVLAQLVTSQDPDNEFIGKIRSIIEKSYNNEMTIELQMRVNPTLIGGFCLTVEDTRLDASVSGELNRLRKALVQ